MGRIEYAEFEAYLDSLSEEEAKEYYESTQADIIIDEEKEFHYNDYLY